VIESLINSLSKVVSCTRLFTFCFSFKFFSRPY